MPYLCKEARGVAAELSVCSFTPVEVQGPTVTKHGNYGASEHNCNAQTHIGKCPPSFPPLSCAHEADEVGRLRRLIKRSSASPTLPLSKREVLVTPALSLQCGVSVVISRVYLNHRNITPHGRPVSPAITLHALSTCILIRNATLQLPIL